MIEPGLSLPELERVRIGHSLKSKAGQHQLINQEVSFSGETRILIFITWYIKDPVGMWLWNKWAQLDWTMCLFVFCSGSNCPWINQYTPYKCRESEFWRFLMFYYLYTVLCCSSVVLCLWSVLCYTNLCFVWVENLRDGFIYCKCFIKFCWMIEYITSVFSYL